MTPSLAQHSTADAPARGLFVVLAGVLLGFGVLMVHSASITSWPTAHEQVYLSRHMLFLAIGLAAAFIASRVPSSVWIKAAPILFSFTIVLLILVLVPGLGHRVKGAQRWLRVGPLTVQPAELAKLALPLLLACLWCRRLKHRDESARSGWRTLPGDLLVLVPIAMAVPLIVMQPDLGTGCFIVAAAGILLFVGGWPIRNFIAAALALIPIGAMLALRPYQMRRITGFFAAWTDWSQTPYQLKQSLMTFGSGGWLGVGLGRGWQKLSFLPEGNTDFVFAVVGEELGLIGTLGVIALWTALYVTGLRLLSRLPRNSFEYVAGFTLLTQLVLQAAVNVAVVTAMLPPKGISHPLLSYGGSNLVVSLVSLGTVLGLTRTPPTVAAAGPRTDEPALRGRISRFVGSG